MPASTVTSKGQITIPVEVRRVLGLRPGSRVDFVHQDDGSYAIVPRTQSITALRGSVRFSGEAVTVEEMDVAIAEGAAARAAR